MSVFAASAPRGAGHDVADLDDARAALDYWEARAVSLPRRAVRGRREARAMAVRWRARVTAAERAAYGAGWRGALTLMAAELRLPEHARQGGRRIARRARQAAAVVVLAVVAIVAATVVAFVALASALVGAI